MILQQVQKKRYLHILDQPKKKKIVQKAGRDSLTMHKNDPEETLKFGGVVEAGGRKVDMSDGT